MNVEKLTKLADFLDDLPQTSFDGWDWGTTKGVATLEHHCGTIACVAGWAVIVEGLILNGSFAFKNKKNIGHCGDVAQKLLGLTDEQEKQLFYPYRQGSTIWPKSDLNPTPKEAAQAIRNLLAKEEHG